MSKIRDSFDNSVRLAVGLGVFDLRRPLFDPLFTTQCYKSVMFRASSILFSGAGYVFLMFDSMETSSCGSCGGTKCICV